MSKSTYSSLNSVPHTIYYGAPNAGAPNTGITTSSQSPKPPSNMLIPEPPITSKVIKIPWKMYKFVNNVYDRKKSVKNAKAIGNAIQQWWNSAADDVGKIKLTSLNETYMIYMNMVIENVPILMKDPYDDGNVFIDKIAILPIVTFKSRDLTDIDDNDFVFGGTMKISKTDPEEIVSVVIEDVEVVAGKYQMQQ